MENLDITLPELEVGHPPPWEDPAASCRACRETLPADALFCGACGEPRHEDPRIGEIALGRYRLIEELGSGGMGAVYRAEQRVGRITRQVAVKILHPEAASSAALRARFLRECEVVVGLEHPNTIRFYDFGELDDGALAIVMELVEGESLAERIERGPISVREAISILRQIAGSLTEAHEAGVVHRDLKPDNVLLFERPGMSVGVKVLDFGIAKAPPKNGAPEEAAITFRGEVLGTPAYMSPEQISGLDLDARSDVYSFAVVAYEMLTGQLPYGRASCLVEWAERHLFDEPTPIDEHRVAAELPAGGREALMSALAKDPVDRPAGVLSLVRALRGDVSAPGESVAPTAAPISAPAPASAPASELDAPVLPTARAPRLTALFAAAVLAGVAALGATAIPAGETSARKIDTTDKPSAALAQCAPSEAPDDCEPL